MQHRKIRVKLCNGERFYCAVDLADSIVPPDLARSRKNKGLHGTLWAWLKKNIPEDARKIDVYMAGGYSLVWIAEGYTGKYLDYVWLRARRLDPTLMAVRRPQPKDSRKPRRLFRHMNETKRQQIVALYQRGLCQNDIGQQVDISQSTVSRVLREAWDHRGAGNTAASADIG